MSEVRAVRIQELCKLVRKYTGAKSVDATALLYKDIGLGGGDYVEFMDEVEAVYGVSLDEVSSRNESRAKDISILELEELISRQIDNPARSG